MTYWFAIVMGAALFTLMIPIVYRIWVGPDGIRPDSRGQRDRDQNGGHSGDHRDGL